MLQFIRLRPGGDFWVGAGFISDHRTASQLLSQREAARMVQNFVQPIILALAYGTCASAQVSRHLAGAWLHAQCAYSHTPTKWREIFAEAQIPYAKIMGCAHFGTVRAASR